MDKNQLRIRPGFILWLLVIFVIIPWLASFLLPANGGKTKAKMLSTRHELTIIAALLNRCATTATSFPCSNGCLLPNAFDPQGKVELKYYLDDTNTQGQLLDIWHTPFQIAMRSETNTTIRSAGPNRSFGDKDDIVYDRSKNEFLKP